MADTEGVEITFNINDEEIAGRIRKASNMAQIKLDAQILKDSNRYCPLDTSNLQKSAITSTVLGSGLITWRTPYAKAQYYGLPNKNVNTNPFASQKWFEVAKSKNIENWVKLANDEFNKNS